MLEIITSRNTENNYLPPFLLCMYFLSGIEAYTIPVS